MNYARNTKKSKAISLNHGSIHFTHVKLTDKKQRREKKELVDGNLIEIESSDL